MGRNQEGHTRPVYGSKEGAAFQVIVLVSRRHNHKDVVALFCSSVVLTLVPTEVLCLRMSRILAWVQLLT